MIYTPIENPEDWKKFLAEPDKHWKKGYSAHTIAHAWQNADGFPKKIQQLFNSVNATSTIRPLMIIPEHKVPLPGGNRPSQNDVWVLARTDEDLFSIAVEGKMAETFGPTVEEWSKDASDGKKTRLKFLCQKLGISEPCNGAIRYQLMHRTISALIEARRFKAKKAIMLVHSFSNTNKWIGDYQFFASQLGVAGKAGELTYVGPRDGIELYIGWVNGDPKLNLI